MKLPTFVIPKNATYDEYYIYLDENHALWIASGLPFYKIRQRGNKKDIEFNLLEKLIVHKAVNEFLRDFKDKDLNEERQRIKAVKSRYFSKS